MTSLHKSLSSSHLALQHGKVWCRQCGREESVNPAHALQYGWPKCCGYTMTIDHPEPREAHHD